MFSLSDTRNRGAARASAMLSSHNPADSSVFYKIMLYKTDIDFYNFILYKLERAGHSPRRTVLRCRIDLVHTGIDSYDPN